MPEAEAASNAMFVQSVGSLLLGADQMGMLDTAPARAPRRWRVRPDREGTDMYNTMLNSRCCRRGQELHAEISG